MTEGRIERTVYRMDRAGSLANLRCGREEIHPPSAGEVCVAVRAIGLNFADIFTIHGLYSATPRGSFIPGLEFAGAVVSVGSGVTSFGIGDKVIGVIRFGAYATHVTVDQQHLLKLPPEWSYEQGSAFLVHALTAYYALIPLGGLCNRDTVLIHSAAGGVGLYANRIAKRFAAFTIGTVGGEHKVPLLVSEGYDKVIVRKGLFRTALREALGERELRIVLECIGGRVFRESLSCLSPGGRLITYGAANFATHTRRPAYLKIAYRYLTRPRVDPLSLMDGNRSVLGFNLIYLWEKADLLREMVAAIVEMKLPPPYVGHTYPFERLQDALHLFQSGTTTGKVVISLSSVPGLDM